jgi:curved DNA-binding protein CbpA
MDNPYSVLDVPVDASKADIEKAYRKKARKSHPDAGGDAGEFKAASRARAILICDESRKRFDETGDASDRPKTAASPAEAMVASLVQEAFIQDAKPPIRWMCDKIDQKRFELKRSVMQAKKQRDGVALKIDKFAKANEGTKNPRGLQFVGGILHAGLVNLDQAIASAEIDIATCTEALTILNDLQYPSDRPSFVRAGSYTVGPMPGGGWVFQ